MVVDQFESSSGITGLAGFLSRGNGFGMGLVSDSIALRNSSEPLAAVPVE
jgi:hypothetical protein